MAKGTKALSAPSAGLVKNGPRGLEGQLELTSEVPCTKDLLGAATFWDLLVAWLGAHDLGRPLILSRIEYCEH